MTNNTRTLGKTRVAALITAAIITLAVFTGCPNAAKPEAPAPEPPAPAPKHAVSFSVEGSGGTLKVKADGITETDMSPITVEQGKTVTFTAVPATDYVVKNWTISGGSLVSGGTENNTTATVKITAETTVKVSFTDYKSVEFGTNGVDLDNYLKNTASATEINYIKVSGLRTTDLIATHAHNDHSLLGKILSDNLTKKVALKFAGNMTGLTDMSGCFYGCPNLVQAPDIPASVTKMSSCFNACGITKAPVIPEGVEDMTGCFVYCTFTKAPVIPASVKYMDNCFQFCMNLKEVPAIPEGVESMERCFWGCASLEMAPVIPASVTNMGNCFKDCTELKSAVLKCNYRDNYFNSAFSGCHGLKEGSIKVPAAQLDTYKAKADRMGTEPDNFAKDE